MLPLRTTPALGALLGIDSLCSVTSFLVSSLMWNLRPRPGQCLKNSIRDTLSNYLDKVENVKFPAGWFCAKYSELAFQCVQDFLRVPVGLYCLECFEDLAMFVNEKGDSPGHVRLFVQNTIRFLDALVHVG